MDEPDTLPLLSIGIAAGGIDNSNREIYEHLKGLQRTVASEAPKSGGGGIHLNLNFELPGPVFAPPPVGVQLARLDEAKGWAVIVCSVPVELRPSDFRNFITSVLDKSLDLLGQATAKARASGDEWDTADLRLLISRIQGMNTQI